MNFRILQDRWSKLSISTCHIVSSTVNLLKDGGPFRMISLIIASSIRKPRLTLHMWNDAWRSHTKPEQWRAKTFYQSNHFRLSNSYQQEKGLARAFRFTDNFSSSSRTHAIRRLLRWSTHTKAEPRSRIRMVEDCLFTMWSQRPEKHEGLPEISPTFSGINFSSSMAEPAIALRTHLQSALTSFRDWTWR